MEGRSSAGDGSEKAVSLLLFIVRTTGRRGSWVCYMSVYGGRLHDRHFWEAKQHREEEMIVGRCRFVEWVGCRLDMWQFGDK
jgi:hypothetical protein